MSDATGNLPVPTAPLPIQPDNQPPAQTDEAAKIAEFEQWLDVPSDIDAILRRAQPLRDWMNDIIAKAHKDEVVTHHVLRYMQADLAMLTATKPRVNFRPRRKYWAPAGQPNLPPPEVVRFSETMELLTNFMVDMGNLKAGLNACARDAKTVRAGWLRLIWREDPERTANGSLITDKQMISVHRYRRLRDDFKAKVFDKDDARHVSMLQLEEYLRTEIIRGLEEAVGADPAPAMAAVPIPGTNGMEVVESIDPRVVRMSQLIEGAPITDEELLQDVPRFLGFDFDVIDIEDVRIDWAVDRPEHINRSRRMAVRTRMQRSEVISKYNLTREQQKMMPGSDDTDINFQNNRVGDKHRDEDPNSRTDNGHAILTGQMDVWEVMDVVDKTVYVMVQGCSRFLHRYTPRNVGPNWYTLFPLWFNEIAGTVYAPSDVELQMSLQNEINEVRTTAREYRKAALPRLAMAKGAMTPEEKVRYEDSKPFQILELDRPDDIAKSIMPLAGISYNPSLVTTNETMVDLQTVAGMPASGLGGVGSSDLATEVAFFREQLASQQDRKRHLFNQFLHNIVREMVYIMLRSLPYENAMAIAGPGCVFPLSVQDRMALFADLELEIDTSPNGKPNVQGEIQTLEKISAIMMQHGMQMSPIWLASRLSDITDQVVDWQTAIVAQAPPEPPAGAAGGGGSGIPGPAPGTPGGGLPRTPVPAELPGGQVPR